MEAFTGLRGDAAGMVGRPCVAERGLALRVPGKQRAFSLQTLLVHIDAGRSCSTRVDAAALLALRQGAWLAMNSPVGLLPPVFDDDVNATAYRHTATMKRIAARASIERSLDRARGHGVADCDGRVVENDPGLAIVSASRYADLLLISPFDEDEPTTTAGFAEEVVLDASCPTLVVPLDHAEAVIGDVILVAWDASTAASRAVHDAMPLLESAKRVRVLTVNAGSRIDGHGADPGVDLAAHLARHDVPVEVLRMTSEQPVGELILAQATEEEFDLVVAGAYGHSRLREIALGGVTRALLRTTSVPVLLSR